MKGQTERVNLRNKRKKLDNIRLNGYAGTCGIRVIALIRSVVH